MTRQHVSTSAHQHVNTSKRQHARTSARQHASTSVISMSTRQHVDTSTPSTREHVSASARKFGTEATLHSYFKILQDQRRQIRVQRIKTQRKPKPRSKPEKTQIISRATRRQIKRIPPNHFTNLEAKIWNTPKPFHKFGVQNVDPFLGPPLCSQ